jgi:hypothetical protein
MELHAHRILRSVEAMAEESEEDPFDDPERETKQLHAV